MKIEFNKINSSVLEEILRELDDIELEKKSISFKNKKDIYVCPECIYLGEKCSRCMD